HQVACLEKEPNVRVANRDFPSASKIFSEEAAVAPAFGILRDDNMTWLGCRLTRRPLPVYRNSTGNFRIRCSLSLSGAFGRLSPWACESWILDLLRHQHGYRSTTCKRAIDEIVTLERIINA